MAHKLAVLLEHRLVSVQAASLSMAGEHHLHAIRWANNHRRVINCHAQCSSCCYYPVNVSLVEGITLYRWLSRHGLWTSKLVSKLTESAERQWGMAYETWMLGLYPCPLLGTEGLCIAYPARPFRCRTLHAVSDPKFCHPHRMGDRTIVVPRTEVMDNFRKMEDAALLHMGVRFGEVPLGSACLAGAEVSKGTCDIGHAGQYIFKHFIEVKRS